MFSNNNNNSQEILIHWLENENNFKLFLSKIFDIKLMTMEIDALLFLNLNVPNIIESKAILSFEM